MLTTDELEQLKSKDISEQDFENQLSIFEKGFPLINIVDSAKINEGIVLLTDAEKKTYINDWKNYTNQSDSIPAIKFVPASGAASRMFKNLFEYLSSGEETEFISAFFNNIKHFPFYNSLNDKCLKNSNLSIDELIKRKEKKTIISNLLDANGLNFGNYSKGILPFHSYKDEIRTAFDEHVSESYLYTKNKNNKVSIHFTVSKEHVSLFKKEAEAITKKLEKEKGIDICISFSYQDPSTDTIAVDMNNKPILIDKKLLFRPGGHGSILKNLNEIGEIAPIVFIKNIDNVVPDSKKKPVIDYAEILGGYFLQIREQIWKFEQKLDKESIDIKEINNILEFCMDKLYIKEIPTTLSKKELIDFLKKKLNRPIRICGMVRNLGEPGGGPYFCKNEDQTVSLQILERNQISDVNPIHIKALKTSTHFNPVNMVCGLTDYKGNKFDLFKYVDPKTGFISIKSKNGINLKALEHPGLWNGSMSDWITIFVEMPENTFNPVKTVNDLLRPMHQQTNY